MTERTRLTAICRPALPRLAALATLALTLGGCAYWPAAGNNGAFYTNVTRPVAVLDAEAPTVRTGTACSTGILGLFAAGNSSINTAKSNAGITKISTVEESFKQYLLGAYTSYCTIVSGT